MNSTYSSVLGFFFILEGNYQFSVKVIESEEQRAAVQSVLQSHYWGDKNHKSKLLRYPD